MTSKRAALSFADQAVASAASFMTTVIVGRGCTKEQLGFYTLGASVVFIALHAQNSLVSMPYTVFLARQQSGEDRLRYNGGALVLQLTLAFLVTIFLAALAGLISMTPTRAQGLAPVIWALALSIALILLRQFVRRICFASLKTGIALVVDSVTGLLQLGGLLLVWRLGLLSAFSAYLLLGVSAGAVAITWLFLRRDRFEFHLVGLQEVVKKHWLFGKWLLTSGLLFAAASQLYPWYLSAIHGPKLVGSLGASMGVALLASPFVVGAANFLDAKAAHVVAQEGPQRLNSTIARWLILLSFSLAVYCLSMLVIGGELVTFIYGAEYSGNGTTVAILSLSVLASALSVPFSSGLMALGRTRWFTLSSLLALLFTSTVGIWMVHRAGVVGAALGIFAAALIVTLVRGVAYLRVVQSEGSLRGSGRTLVS